MDPSQENGNRSNVFIRVSTACIILPTIAVILRFWSRAVGQKGRFGWDDWICLLALAFNITLCGMGIGWAHLGLGRHIDTLPPEEIEAGLKILFGCYFVFDISIGLIKNSVLCFYMRVFGRQNRAFNIALWVGQTFTFLWYIFTILNDSLTCNPPSKNWDLTEKGHCAPLFPGYLVTGIWDSLLDLYILILPLPILWGTQIGLKRKLLAGSAFILGYCCLVVSVGRLVTTIVTGHALSEDLTWNAVDILTWTFIEPGIGIISICVPSWYHLYTRARRQGLSSLFTSKEHPSMSQINFAWNRRRQQQQQRQDGSSSTWWSRPLGSSGRASSGGGTTTTESAIRQAPSEMVDIERAPAPRPLAYRSESTMGEERMPAEQV